MTNGQDAGKSFAYVLGVFLGDGCVTMRRKVGETPRPQFRLNTIDEDFANAVKTALRDLTDYSVTMGSHAVSKSSKPNWYLVVGDTPLCDRLVNDTDKKRVIPAYVWEWPRPLKLAFIVGLMDSEGFVAAKTDTHTGRRFYMGYKSCDVWVPDFIRLLQSVGIEHGKIGVEKPLRPGYKTPTRFAIKMQSWVDSGARFNIARKQKRVDEWAATEPYSQRSRYPRKLAPETTRTALAQSEMKI